MALSDGLAVTAGGAPLRVALEVPLPLAFRTCGPRPLSVHEAVERRLEGPLAWLPRTRRRRAVRTVKLLK